MAIGSVHSKTDMCAHFLQVGCAEIVGRIVEDLKDESEPYRRMVMETVDKVVHELGSSDLDARLEELLIDGILYAFQEQASDDANVMLNGFGTVVNSLKMRAKPYLPQICGTIKWRLNNKGAKIRQQAADLIARIAVVMKVRPSKHSCALVALNSEALVEDHRGFRAESRPRLLIIPCQGACTCQFQTGITVCAA